MAVIVKSKVQPSMKIIMLSCICVICNRQWVRGRERESERESEREGGGREGERKWERERESQGQRERVTD